MNYTLTFEEAGADGPAPVLILDSEAEISSYVRDKLFMDATGLHTPGNPEFSFELRGLRLDLVKLGIVE